MNDRGIVCIRYIDDFILFGKTEAAAFKALAAGQRHLASLGLDIYEPTSDKPAERAKADHGPVSDGFTFLGCDVKGERVSPSRKSRKKLVEKVEGIFSMTLGALDDPKRAILDRHTYAETVLKVSQTIRGWGNTSVAA